MLRKIFFNLWYFRSPPWDTGISPPELVEFLSSTPPGRALDLGCGTGTNVITIARFGWQVVGVDFARRAVHLARGKIRKAGVQADLKVEDVTRLKGIAGPFDLILDIGCFHNLSMERKPAYISNLERLLTPSGTYLLYAFFKAAGDSGPGLLEEDVQKLCAHLALTSRQDGFNRGDRPSAWFRFKRREQPSVQPDAPKND